ncbi:MAG: hypothetical protein M2R45_02413 [Verrucomicrobia subdivision 3 bacterium]|nr:hypothetical protein [Limisphaerales bacterium]MCS1416381.1 hypothetical protein [Limisphaerales bacterium]
MKPLLKTSVTAGLLAVVVAISALFAVQQANGFGYYYRIWIGLTPAGKAVIAIAGSLASVIALGRDLWFERNPPTDKNGRVLARPDLEGPSDSVRYGSWLNRSDEGSEERTRWIGYADYEYYIIGKVQAMQTWDPIYGWWHPTGAPTTISGDSYKSLSDLQAMRTADNDPYLSKTPGTFIDDAESEKQTCGDFTVVSEISGGTFKAADGQLAAATPHSVYTVRVTFDRKRMIWDSVNHRWAPRRYFTFTKSNSSVSAVKRVTYPVTLVEDDTKLKKRPRARGWSNIVWKRIEEDQPPTKITYHEIVNGMATGNTYEMKNAVRTEVTYVPIQNTDRPKTQN